MKGPRYVHERPAIGCPSGADRPTPSNVTRTGSRAGARSWVKGSMNMSRVSSVLALLKAIELPSGEKDGSSSPTVFSGGNVMRRFSPSRTESRFID
jgi:hypothetical protein